MENLSDQKVGVLLVNLGTPDAPTPSAVRKFLAEFLSDPRVIEANRLVWWCVLRIILLIRPRKVAPKYKGVWTDQGSPLLAISKQQAAALSKALSGKAMVALAMRYGSPQISVGIDALLQHGVQRLIVLPMYPQYSGTTTASIFDAVTEHLAKKRDIPELCLLKDFHSHPQYIEALANTVKEHWAKNGRANRLLMSFHGIPQRYIKAGDPYASQCVTTATLLATALELKSDEWLLSFQSRVGREPWLEPYTDATVAQLAKDGKSIDIMCPGFSADCLETLEEITDENREVYEDNGGTAENYRYISCLNDRDDHIGLLEALVLSRTESQVI